MRRVASLLWLVAVACGTSKSGGTSSTSGSTGTSDPDAGAVDAGPLTLGALEVAQTHVIPAAGLQLAAAHATETLRLAGGRDALALVQVAPSDGALSLEGWAGAARLGAVPLAPPAQLPPTEASGPAYATDRWSAVVPGAWVKPGLSLRVVDDRHAPSEPRAVAVGADTAVDLRVLPFYLFGANDSNTAPLASVQAPDDATLQEVRAKWPVARVTARPHPAVRVDWPAVSIGPRPDQAGVAQPAYVITAADQQRDTFGIMSATLGVLGKLRAANGDGPGPSQDYGPLLLLDGTGKQVSAGGGLGSGGGIGVGTAHYTGIFIHEQGHAMGLPHQGDGYEAGNYPYLAGSLQGSAWGYDPDHREFLAPFVPSTSSRYSTCQTLTVYTGTDADGGAVTVQRLLDASGRCVKQDPMQSGDGDQAAGYRFATFSDYSAAMMQRWYEGVAADGGDGQPHTYAGGRLFEDEAQPGAYKRWDSLDQAWVPVAQATASKGIFGLDLNLPIQRDVPVHAVIVVYTPATPSASLIYPPLSFRGNLLHTIDPSDTQQRASIVPDTGTYPWYCRNGGCDYTLRVTYADATVRTVLLQGGFRPFNQATGTPPASASDPLDPDSRRVWAVNVPAPAAIQKLELLDTPQVWQGLPASPTVLISR